MRSVASRAPLGRRPFPLLWAGQSVSAAGDAIVAVAQVLAVLRVGGGAADIGFVIEIQLLARFVFGTQAGARDSDALARRTHSADRRIDYYFKCRLPLYYGVAFYHAVEYALACGLRKIYYGIESADAKAPRGCRIVNEYGMVYGLDAEARAALSQVLSGEITTAPAVIGQRA